MTDLTGDPPAYAGHSVQNVSKALPDGDYQLFLSNRETFPVRHQSGHWLSREFYHQRCTRDAEKGRAGMDRNFILNEIRRQTVERGGVTPGRETFVAQVETRTL